MIHWQLSNIIQKFDIEQQSIHEVELGRYITGKKLSKRNNDAPTVDTNANIWNTKEGFLYARDQKLFKINQKQDQCQEHEVESDEEIWGDEDCGETRWEVVSRSVTIRSGRPAVTTQPRFLQDRCACGMVELGGEVQLFGGSTNEEVKISSVERQDNVKKKWLPWGHMPRGAGVVGMGVAVVNEQVVTVGGIAVDESAAGNWLFSPFNEDGQQWVEIRIGDKMPAMINPVVFAADSQLVVLGGYKREVIYNADDDNGGEQLFDQNANGELQQLDALPRHSTYEDKTQCYIGSHQKGRLSTVEETGDQDALVASRLRSQQLPRIADERITQNSSQPKGCGVTADGRRNVGLLGSRLVQWDSNTAEIWPADINSQRWQIQYRPLLVYFTCAKRTNKLNYLSI